MRVSSALRAAPVACLVAACLEPVQAPPDVAATLRTLHAFEGAEVLVTSQAFALYPTAHVVAGDSVLQMRTVDDTTVAVRPPSSPGDTISGLLELVVGGGRTFLGRVRLYGFRESLNRPDVGTWPLVANTPEASLIGYGESTLVRYSLRTGSLVDLGIRVGTACLGRYGPGPTADPHVVTILGLTCRTYLVRFAGSSATIEDSLAYPGRTAAAFSDGSFLIASSHNLGFYRPTAGSSAPAGWWYQSEGTGLLLMSPDRTRVVPLGGYFANNAPVFATTADSGLAFEIPEPRYLLGAAFSPDGDTLFISSTGNGQSPTSAAVRSLDAHTGTVHASVDVAGAPHHLATDAGGPWLYGYRPAEGLRVFDRRTLAPVTDLQLPHGLTYDHLAYLPIVVDAERRELWVGLDQTLVYRFALPPAGQP